jgi:hypothetical protein
MANAIMPIGKTMGAQMGKYTPNLKELEKNTAGLTSKVYSNTPSFSLTAYISTPYPFLVIKAS